MKNLTQSVNLKQRFFHRCPVLPRRSRSKTGFTLIELLIVIAIILILIAIALPNFLEAQIRAKVVRAKGEIRTLVTAMEAYFLDWQFYPTRTQGNINVRPRGEAGHRWLTSPIAYISFVPEDPFAGTTRYSGTDNTQRTFESGGIETIRPPCISNLCMETWVIYSSGPSENSEPLLRATDAHYTKNGVGGENHVISYSPTNGTRSEGVIHRYGGDSFWIGVALSSANRGRYRATPQQLDMGLWIDTNFYLHTLPPPGL